MASTFTTNFGFEEIATGEQSGTWGTTTNFNFDILDRIASYKAVGLSGTTHTLTVREASPGQGTENLQDGMYRVIKFTGALGGNNTVTVAPNTSTAYFIFENATTDSGSSGPYSVIISQGTGANVTIENGNNAIVYCDGAGSGAAVTNALGDLQVSALTVDGDATIGDDLTLISDASVLGFGANTDVTLTHVHDTGLLLNSTMQLQFSDASQYINAPSATVLDINATDEIEINATLADVNANLDVSGTYQGGGLMTTGGNIVVPDDANIGSASDTDAIAISSAGVVSLSATTEASATGTAALVTAGGLGVAKDLWLGDDLVLDSDAAVVSFGDNQEVTLTHVHDTGLLLNSTMQLQFNDDSQYINAPDATTLDINATDEIELNATLVDLNGKLEVSGTTTIDASFRQEGNNALYKESNNIYNGRTAAGAFHNTEGQGLYCYYDADDYVRILGQSVSDGSPVWQAFAGGGTIKSEIEANGDFQSATNSYGATSDERLKEYIIDSGSQWDDVKAMRVRKYSLISDETDAPTQLGVIAQELEASGMNGLVKTKPYMNPPADGDGPDEPVLDANGNPTDYKAVKYSVLYMKAVKALQEAMERIESLESRIDALEATG